MSDLEKEIKRVQTNLILQDYYIQEQNNELIKHKLIAKALPFAVIGSFAFGLLLTRKKTITQSVTTLVKLSLMGQRFYNKVKNILAFL